MLEREPEEARSPSSYPGLFPKTRRLVAAEWVWRDKRAFLKNNQELFGAQFVLGKDLAAPPDEHQPVGKLYIERDELSAAQSVSQREIIERNSPFQARLRDWLLGD